MLNAIDGIFRKRYVFSAYMTNVYGLQVSFKGRKLDSVVTKETYDAPVSKVLNANKDIRHV